MSWPIQKSLDVVREGWSSVQVDRKTQCFVGIPVPVNHLDWSGLLELKRLQLASHRTTSSGKNVLNLWHTETLEVLSVWHWHIRARDTLKRRVQVVKSIGFHEDTGNLGTNTVLTPALFDRDNAAGLLHRLDDRLTVKWTNRAQVDHFGVHAFLRKHFGGLERETDHARESNDGHVRAFLHDLGLADRDHKVLVLGLLAHWEGDTVEEFVLEHNDWVWVADRSLEETTGVFSVVWHNDLETRHGTVPGGKALRVLGSDTSGSTVGTTEDNWHVNVTGRHVELLGSRVKDVVNGLQGEVERHELDDWLGVVVGGTDGETRETGLGDRGVDDTLVTVLLPEALADLVGTVILGDFLTNEEDLLVAGELFVDGRVERITHRHLARDGGHGSAQERGGGALGARAAEHTLHHGSLSCVAGWFASGVAWGGDEGARSVFARHGHRCAHQAEPHSVTGCAKVFLPQLRHRPEVARERVTSCGHYNLKQYIPGFKRGRNCNPDSSITRHYPVKSRFNTDESRHG